MRTRATRKARKAIIDAQIANQELLMKSIEHLPEQVIKNVETIASHQERHRRSTRIDRRAIKKIATIFGRPQFLYFQIAFFSVWIISSGLVDRGVLQKNFPLFNLEIHGLGIASLLISTEVLIDRTGQEKLNKERSHLILQINLVTEQKIAKLISLVEELRADLPNVINREDLEAEIMKQAIDPQAILEVLQQTSVPQSRPPTEDENR
jgi:uncharacterized membrane protein